MKTFWDYFGRLLNLNDVESLDHVQPSFAAPWAHDNPAWVLFGCVALAALAMAFYTRTQLPARVRVRAPLRYGLAAVRATLLCLLLLILAEPILMLTVTSNPRPLLWVLLDGTESMAIEDDLLAEERTRWNTSVGLPAAAGSTSQADEPISRTAYVQAFLRRKDNNVLQALHQRFRLRPFVMDRLDGVRPLVNGDAAELLDGNDWAEQLTATGDVTALGAALDDLGRRGASGNLAGVVIFSDFAWNAGPRPLESAKKLGVPIYAIGVGPVATVDIAVHLDAPLLMKKAERSSLSVELRQSGLNGEQVTVQLFARPLGGAGVGGEPVEVDAQEVVLDGPTKSLEFPYTPTETGRFEFSARVATVPGEVVGENNLSEPREVNIRDDFLRLMFVEYEPTWEWRFIKEVFHRDQLVGMRGFRTFLRSADPKVRQTNELFLPTLTPQRSDFFANDVIVIGDLPASALSARFCQMTKEFVGTFGGGLVIVAGPRFGPGQLVETELADMLPVNVDPTAQVSDKQAFVPRVTAQAELVDFMQLGDGTSADPSGWSNLGTLPWYQPVAGLSSAATVLMEHPQEVLADGQTPQPLMAIRRYGQGEVVYLGFNETWRLRRKHGEKYYRQFWGQMIHRLGLSHALGSQKRFVVRTDRQKYQPDQKVVVTVEAYDENYEPLPESTLPDRQLRAELIVPGTNGDSATTTHPFTIAELREGRYEAQVPVHTAGEHLLRVTDPVTNTTVEASFQVASLSIERRSAVRNVALQNQLATATGGRGYDLPSAHQLLDDISLRPQLESQIKVLPIWNTWISFLVVVLLMLGEWLVRKWVSLP